MSAKDYGYGVIAAGVFWAVVAVCGFWGWLIMVVGMSAAMCWTGRRAK